MKQILLIATVFIFTLGNMQAQQVVKADGYEISVYNFEELKPMLTPKAGNNTLYVFNFWATYCAPCIKELPHFDKINEEYKDKNVKVILISLDFKKDVASRVIPFIKRRNVQSEVVVLSDPDADSWINQISPSWSGAIPATLLVKGDKKQFFEKEFTYDELQAAIKSFNQ